MEVVPSTITMMNLIIVLWALAFSFAIWSAYLNFHAHYQTPSWLLRKRYSRGIKHPAGFRNVKRPKPKRTNIPTHLPAWRQLLVLVRHDEKTAVRLYNYAKNCNPGKSEKWVLEKALWDLERDRF
ncbi:MAG: hypothetical protein WBF90_35960 [Rivularia sp. (in: cyanobacteria)]